MRLHQAVMLVYSRSREIFLFDGVTAHDEVLEMACPGATIAVSRWL